MSLFSFSKKKDLIPSAEQPQILEAIRWAEQKTSGEVRVYVESHCRFVNPMDRALEVFHGLKMSETKDRNAVLVYVALKDHQLAIYGDEGIHSKVGDEYWKKEVRKMVEAFNGEHIAAGIAAIVTDIGDALHTHFPYERDTDKNELPDEIVFGQ